MVKSKTNPATGLNSSVNFLPEVRDRFCDGGLVKLQQR